jgi:hypothetical protein
MDRDENPQNLPTVPSPRTLNTILTVLSDHERLTETMSEPDLVPPPGFIIEELKAKADSIYGVRCAMENASAGIKLQIDRLKEVDDAIKSNLKRLDNMVIWNMQNSQSEKIPGNTCRIVLSYTKVCEPLTPAPQMSDCASFPQFVRTKLEWDKTAIKNAWKDGVDVSAVASILENPHVKFSPTVKVLEGKK